MTDRDTLATVQAWAELAGSLDRAGRTAVLTRSVAALTPLCGGDEGRAREVAEVAVASGPHTGPEWLAALLAERQAVWSGARARAGAKAELSLSTGGFVAVDEDADGTVHLWVDDRATVGNRNAGGVEMSARDAVDVVRALSAQPAVARLLREAACAG